MKKLARILFAVAAILSLVDTAISESKTNAAAIKAELDRIPEKNRWRAVYLDLDPHVGVVRNELEASIKYMVCQTSFAPVMERILPQRLPGTTLLRIDLRELGWKLEDWQTVLKQYPYWDFERHNNTFPVSVRADWLLLELADQAESEVNAYFRLLFGGENIPQNRDDFLAKLGVVSNRPDLRFGLIEGQSGVAQRGTRWLESYPVLRGACWGTRDSSELLAENDPMEHPDGSFKHEAEEWIIGLPVSSESGVRGFRFIFGLSNAQGELQTKAPVNIVQDFTNFRGHPEIVNPGSCIQCHTIGYNLPTLNEFRAQVESGIVRPSVLNNEKAARDLAAFHLTDQITEIHRANEDYQKMVILETGLESKELAVAFKNSIDRYVARLDLTTMAEEFVPQGYTVEQVVNAFTKAANEGVIGSRMSDFIRNGRMPREAWEQQYVIGERVVHKWGNEQ